MPFRFSSPACQALRSQKFYSHSENISFIASAFFLYQRQTLFRTLQSGNSKVDGEEVVLKTRDPTLQMLYD